MARLSPTLKALINTPHARPNTIPAPKGISSVYERIAQDAALRNVGQRSWLALATAATMTMNSPDSLAILFKVAISQPPGSQATRRSQKRDSDLATAEFMREVGLKCISFNGIPRTINSLATFRASLPPDIRSQLATQPTRIPKSPSEIYNRGLALWTSVYAPHDGKLIEILAKSHPDLPVHILNSHYGALLSDPNARTGLAKVGRVLTSVVAIACLRAQSGVGPQVLSHVYGLRKAWEDGTWREDTVDGGEDGSADDMVKGDWRQDMRERIMESIGESEEGVKYLASDEGSEWVLKCVDGIVAEIGGGEFTYAQVVKAKL